MQNRKPDIAAVPTNIITGFLGVGKSSTILNLLKNKPEDETWAVLVNEFGEIGVDGSLMAGQLPQAGGVYIREVPGGCMCCAAGVPMQVALNQLISRSAPDRLLIEPTGLGHPKEILQVLSSAHNQALLSLEKIIALVDARVLVNERYTANDTFNQQISIADTVVGNKSELYSDEDRSRLRDYIKLKGAAGSKVIYSSYGDITFSELEGPASFRLENTGPHLHIVSDKPLLSDSPLPDCGFIKAVNQGEGFVSIGWRFSSDIVFDREKLLNFARLYPAERIKAVFITDTGAFSLNMDKDVLTEMALEHCSESRIEIIAEHLSDKLEDSLMQCVAFERFGN